jgi:hypothetical protein
MAQTVGATNFVQLRQSFFEATWTIETQDTITLPIPYPATSAKPTASISSFE